MDSTGNKELNKTLIYISRSRLHRNRANLIQTLNTVCALLDKGVNVKLYLPRWKKYRDPGNRLRELGVPPSLPLYPTNLLRSSLRLWPFITFKKKELLAADMVYTRSPEISRLLITSNIPHSVEIHGIRDLENRGLLEIIIEAHRQNKVSYLFPISQQAADNLTRKGAVSSRIRVCPSGVNLGPYKDIPPFDRGHMQKPVIVHIGRIGIKRGLEIFEAIAAKKLAEVILVGEPDKDFPASCNLKPRPPVPHSEVPFWYGKSDIILLPYQDNLLTSDSMSPMKLFEALASGRPIIASDLPPLREIIEHRISGILVDPSDTRAWLHAIEDLRNNPGLAQNLAINARKRAEDFTWEKRAHRILDAFGWL